MSMLCFQIEFPAGRYHATPWGAHVNEGHVEWPPSPWRFIRALLAVGYTRVWAGEVPPKALRLFEKLARTLPRYSLPSAALGHSRHYMPTVSGPKLDTTKVIDAFAYVGEGRLVLGYPGEFSPDERDVAKELCERLPYLGRAESWAIGRLLDAAEPVSFNCVPLTPDESVGAAERIDLLAPQTPEDFASWRARTLELAWQERLAAKVEDATRKGKAPAASLTKSEQEKVATTFPASWIDSIGWDTNRLQRGGWDMPPGARWSAYRRPMDAMRVSVATPAPRVMREHVDTALLALSSDARRADVFPPLRDALRRTDLIHKTLVALADPTRTGSRSGVLTGSLNGTPLRGHRHAQLIPVSLNCRPDRFDHVLVYAGMGLDETAREALGAIRRTYAKNMPDLFVSLAGLGSRADFAKRVPQLRTASVWRSCSPFVPPRFLKRQGRNSIRGQLEAELTERGIALPADVRIEVHDGRFVRLEEFEPGMRPTTRFRHVRLERADTMPPMRATFSLELTFERPASGPIALGYGCHFGLGVFAPIG